MEVRGRKGGFTLVELVVVITILGVLAAFAIPRFVSLESQTRLASRNAMLGSLRAGAALAHALWMANGQAAEVSMDGKSITIVNGYPSAVSIQNTLSDTSGYTRSTNGSTTTFASTSASTCTLSYSEAAAENTAPTIAAGTGAC